MKLSSSADRLKIEASLEGQEGQNAFGKQVIIDGKQDLQQAAKNLVMMTQEAVN
jgi:hypothetical protein